MAQPFVEPCSRGIIEAQPCPRALGREIAPHRRRMVLAGCILASSMAFIDSFGTDGRAAQAARRGRRRSRLRSVGSQRLCAGARVADIDRRRARRHLWQGPHARDRLSVVRCGLGRLRGGALGRLAHRGAGRAGDCGRPGDAGEPRSDRCHLSQGGAQPGDRGVGGRIGADDRRRARAGRLADRDIRLAGGVLDQPAAGGRRGRSAVGAIAPDGPARAAPVRRGRRGDRRGGARSAGLGPEPDRPRRGRRGGLDLVGAEIIVAAGLGLAGLVALRALGALERPSDDAAAAGAEPRLPRAQRRDPAALCGACASCSSCCRSIWSTGADCRRPMPGSSSCRSRSASVCCRGRSAASRTRSGRRAMLIAGPLGATLAYAWLALGQDASLLRRRDRPHDASGHLVCRAGGAVDRLGHVERGVSRRGSRVRHQQCGEPRRPARRRGGRRRRRLVRRPATGSACWPPLPSRSPARWRSPSWSPPRAPRRRRHSSKRSGRAPDRRASGRKHVVEEALHRRP